jgi:hypothetical protein
MPPSIKRNQVFAELVKQVSADPGLIASLERSFIPEERGHFTAALQELLPEEHRASVKDVWTSFLTYCK